MMEGFVPISEFINYLQENDLVIAPAAMVRVDKGSLQKTMLGKPFLTFKEIADSGLWGDISQKRAYQIGKQWAKPHEIIKAGQGENSPVKMVTVAVKRIATQRKTLNHIS